MSDPQLMNVFRKIRAAIGERKMSMTELADRSGLDRSHLTHLFQGKVTGVTVGTLRSLAKALDAELEIDIDLPVRA